jgi:GTP cyclohydrolase I
MADVLWAYRRNGDIGQVSKLLDVQFSDEYESLVMVGPISVTALCSHHVLPWLGTAWVGYLPDGKICGLSKLARIVEFYARQLTLQERVTQEVADALDQHLRPKGVMVVIKATHGCMTMRGVEEPDAETVTSAVRGVFLSESSARQEFLALMKARR